MNAPRYFTGSQHLAINDARQQHLASLGLDLSNRRVLEVGAGIGLHTGFFLERNCDIVVTDGNQENLQEIRQRHPSVPSQILDLDKDESLQDLGTFDIVYCYGLLYHLHDPDTALKRLSEITTGQILLETRVDTDPGINLRSLRDHGGNTGSIHGTASRASRAWIMQKLKQYFGYAYASVTQPDHPDFVLDWTKAQGDNNRAIFVGSRIPLDLPGLSETLIDRQSRYQTDMKGN